MSEKLEKSLRAAAILVALGLFVELASLTWRHPLSFVVFVGAGGLLMAAGILYFLYNIVSQPRQGD